MPIIIISLCGCNFLKKTEDNSVTYDMLTDEQKAVVDYVFNRRADWEKGCTGASFTTQDGENVFSVSYYEQIYSDTIAGWIKWYAYDVEANRFEVIDSKYKSYTGYTTSGTTKSPSFLISWYSNWTDARKKDYLSDRYYNFISEE